MNEPELDIRRFIREDYPAYFSWFQDPELNKRLGPMEEEDEWLDSVLTEQDACTYSAFQKGKLLAVIGIIYPSTAYPAYYVTNIAVNPSLRSQGIGKQVLYKVMNLLPLKEGQSWIARVDVKNPRAKLFFENNGWNCISYPPENNDMYVLEYKSKRV